MNTTCCIPAAQVDPERLLVELDQVEVAIGSAESWLATLEHRRDELITVLDAATRPLPSPAAAVSRTIYRGVSFRGEITQFWDFIDIHLHVLRRLWRELPERRDAMAVAMAQRGTSRRYVSQERGRLFSGKSEGWVQKYSVRLVDGWYADTNLSVERIRTLLPTAVRAAGLNWGDEVKVFWRTTVLE